MKFRYIFLTISYLVPIFTVQANTVYVNHNATGLNNGTSWKNAYTSYETAFDFSQDGDVINIAKGIYYCTRVLNLHGTIYGGYSDTDSTAARNSAINETIISATDGLYLQNIFTVGNHVVIDGLIIQNTFSYGPGSAVSIGGANDVVFRNCIFRNNHTNAFGSAVHLQNQSDVSFINCFFLNNYTAIYCSASSCAVQNCVFSDNYGDGGVCVNCVQSTCTITNATFVRTTGGSVLQVLDGSSVRTYNSIFYGSVLNDGNTDSQEAGADTSSTLIISSCITENFSTGTDLHVSKSPKFKDTTNLAGPDGHFFTSDDGLQLLNPGSLAINGGNNSYSSTLSTDITGMPRVFNSTVDLGAYELQEIRKKQPRVLYVNKRATGKNDGSNWKNAFTDLQKALYYVSDTIKVAAGTYYASSGDPTYSFWPENKRVILGGYPNKGKPTDNMRNPTANPTILDGNLPLSNGVHSYLIVRCRRLDSTAVVDGLIIQESQVPSGSYILPSTAIYVTGSSCVVRNCTFTNGNGKSGVGAHNALGAKPKYINCNFLNNTGEDGAALLNRNANPAFINCVFKNNTTIINIGLDMFHGGVMVNDFAAPNFDSCSFIDNSSNLGGGVAWNKNGSAPVFRNCVFLGNRTFYGGTSDFLNEGSHVGFYNCIIDDNAYTKNDYGTSCYNDNSTAVFENCKIKNCRAGNSQGGVAHNLNGSSLTFKTCSFYAIQALEAGAIIYNELSSSVTLVNCLALYNSGISPLFFSDDDCFTKTINCTFANNIASGPVIIAPNNANTSVINCIFWNNNLNGYPDIFGPSDAMIVKNNITQLFHGKPQDGNFTEDPKLQNISDPDGNDNLLLTPDDGFIPSDCSVAIDHGLNGADLLDSDIVGNNRIYNGTVDIGAYEFSTAPVIQHTYYVNAKATGDNSGTSWQNAFTNLQSAVIWPCADTIKIAAGAYKPAVQARDSSFYINASKVILGGYPDNGNPTDSERNPTMYQTVLSGEIGNLNSVTDNSFHVVVCDSPAPIYFDGVYVSGGYNADQTAQNSDNSYGAGIYLKTGTLSLANCIISDNKGTYGGGLYLNSETKYNLNKTIFKQNSAKMEGGGVANGSYDPAGLIINCVFENNHCDKRGGGLRTIYSKDVRNCIFYRNDAAFGGGVDHNGKSVSFFRNCTFANNNSSSATGGGGFYNDYGCSVTIANCLFTANTSKRKIMNGGDIYANAAYHAVVVTNTFSMYIADPWHGDSYYIANTITDAPGFNNFAFPKGNDSTWYTLDDGLQLVGCSSGINQGSNAHIQDLPPDEKDILGFNRVIFDTVDTGPYEYNGIAGGIYACLTPSGLNTSDITSTTAKVSWSPNLCAINYQIQTRAQGDTGWQTFTASFPGTSYKLTGLIPNKTYEWRIATTCQSNNTLSPYSDIQTFTTINGLIAMGHNGYYFQNSAIENLKATIIPNPARSFAVVRILGSNGPFTILVTDLRGKTVSQRTGVRENTINISLQDLAAGIYLVTVRDEHTRNTFKLVKVN